MLEYNMENTLHVLGLVSLAVISVFFGIQKLLKSWNTSNAESSVISIMHTELERMSTQNTALSVELGRLHTEVIALNTQLQKLTIENQRLQSEVITLTNEVTRLQAVLHKESYYGSSD